ncbi:hypothetical protein [Frondihabitans sp. PhB188]|uniref:hypothetical protein n=1 Tax=Frondihabitans sp. PhB188 TaxID=2485200 RepID=UPI000F464A98|nr:hypothetical protein [Frondihabitans sp. PhB188]
MSSSPLPDPLAEAPFAVADAYRAGVGVGRLRAADLAVPFLGVRAVSPAADLAGRCREAALVLGADQCFSHLTAAALWGLPLPSRYADRPVELHVSTTGSRAMRRPGVIGHRITPVARLLLDGLPVVDPVTAWAQCSEQLRVDDLVAMADGLLGEWSTRPRARLVERELLERAAASRAGSRGVVALREALDLARSNVRSPGETRLRLLLVRGGLPEPELNVEVRDDDDRWLGIGDLVFRDARVVVEYEGDGHRVDRKQFESDIDRRERFADARWRTIRVTGGALRTSSSQVVARVRKHVLGADASPAGR